MAKANKKMQEETIEMTEDQNIESVAEEAVLEQAEPEMAEEAVETVEESNVEAEAEAEELAITQDDVRLVEAILFASATSVSVSMIAERFPEERVKLIPDVLELLQEQYANRGVNLVQRDNRWALRTSADLGDQMRLEKEQPKKFTRAAQETMAIIAYHQPVTRAEIENIRGVATSAGALDALMEAGWIKPGKRREVPGRPVTWLTTQAFLDHFGLEKIEDLPGMEDLKAAGLLDKRPAIEAMPTADLFDGEGKADEHDPQEVTDEDLIGKSGIEDEEGDTEAETSAESLDDASDDNGGFGEDSDEDEDEGLSDDEDDLDDGDANDAEDEGDYENESDDEDFDDDGEEDEDFDDDEEDDHADDEDDSDNDDDDDDDYDDEDEDEDDFEDEDDEDDK